MGAAGRAQPTVNVAPARNAVLFDCLIDGAGGAPLALLLLALAFGWLLSRRFASGTGPVRATLQHARRRAWRRLLAAVYDAKALSEARR